MWDERAEVIVIGSGIGGLCCAALLARYGFDTLVCESHAIPGGAAHSFERDGYVFDSGPSLHSGLGEPSANPLQQVIAAVGETVPCATYDTWGCWLPEGDFNTSVGADQFCDVLRDLRGDRAVAEWRDLQRKMAPLSAAAVALPPLALRFDLGAIASVGRYAAAMGQHALSSLRLTGPFAKLMAGTVRDPFVRNWLDLLCFLLSGLPARGTSAAEMAFMFAEWYKPGVRLDYPCGGSGAIVDALVRGLQRHGGRLRLGAHVEEIVLDSDRAAGVRLRGGKRLRAERAVVSNASIWDTLRLLPDSAATRQLHRQRGNTPACASFMHLHLGIDASGLPTDLPCHHITVNDWSRGVEAEQNVALASIPSVLDPSLAPPGKHVLHVYTPGNEPYAPWAGLDRRSDAYAQLKQTRSRGMWQALERIIPDIRDRCDLTLVGTPLTHARFLRRDRGTYGPALSAADGLFPGPLTPVRDLLCCGDSTFPGIGLPAVAASGAIAANTLAPLREHLRLLDDLSCP